jgi:putative membrane protein
MSFADLPAVNALLNGASAVFLGFGYWFIRRKNQQAHHSCMRAAFLTSVVFLVSYLTYHGYQAYWAHRGPTRFLDPKWFRPIYLAILLSHTVLAMVTLPLAIITYSLALFQRFERHRKIARWTWPLWMYVSVTGVLIYLLLYQIFPQNRDTATPASPTWSQPG